MKPLAPLSKPIFGLFPLITTALVLPAFAGTPPTKNAGAHIVLDAYNGHFAARDTLVDLKPGDNEFVVTNLSDKLVGSWWQDGETHEQLDKFAIEPGETRTPRVKFSRDGFRYRCPIHPTPWYDVAVE